MSSRSTDRTTHPLQQGLCVGNLQDRRTQPETAIVALFRDVLLRCLLCVGTTIADHEEIIQEVFLSLFQHVQRGHLRGWWFRVAHRLALKQRYRTNRNGKTVMDEKAVVTEERQCLTLRAEELSYRETTTVRQMSPGAVSVSLTRPLVRMVRVAKR